MEFGVVFLVAISGALGLALRGIVSPTLARACAVIGLASLSLGLCILVLTAFGRSPFDTLTGGLVAVVAFCAAALIIPFAFVVGRGR